MSNSENRNETSTPPPSPTPNPSSAPQPLSSTHNVLTTVLGGLSVAIFLIVAGVIVYNMRGEIGLLNKDAQNTPIGREESKNIVRDWNKELGIEMVHVRGGTFRMGCNIERDDQCYDDESPLRNVTVSDFSIGKYEITQAQWVAVMGSNQSHFYGDNLPVDNVTWNDVHEFIRALNSMTGRKYRLPTEAEWEYAARGGQQSRGYNFAGSDNVNDVGWYDGNSGGRTRPVGGKAPNELGIYDMSGNVREWVGDWHGIYGSYNETNPVGSRSGTHRAGRGGGWDVEVRRCRVSNRHTGTPAYRPGIWGFRLALSH